MSKLLLSVADGVASLTINRPEARNALDWETQGLFLAAINQLRLDPSIRALIITGVGEKAFCAGGDLVELADYPRYEDGQRLSEGMTHALALLESAPFPSIAAINGHAFGGGAEIALACDLRLMSHQAQFGLVQLSLGLPPGWGAGQRLGRLLGYSRALQLLLNAQPISSEEALRLGLVNEVVPQGLALGQALLLAQRIAQWDSNAVASIKRILQNRLSMTNTQAQAAEQAEFAPLWAAEAHLQAVEAFLQRKR
jgi:enoyl-CoA hydratase